MLDVKIIYYKKTKVAWWNTDWRFCPKDFFTLLYNVRLLYSAKTVVVSFEITER